MIKIQKLNLQCLIQYQYPTVISSYLQIVHLMKARSNAWICVTTVCLFCIHVNVTVVF